MLSISAAKNHCSLYSLSHTVLPPMASELKAAGIQVSGATLHFEPGAALPGALVRKVLLARLAELGAR